MTKNQIDTLLDIYFHHTWSLTIFNIDHHWKLVTKPDLNPSCIRLVRYYDVKDFLPEKDYLHFFFYDNPICFMYPMSFMSVFTGFGFRSVESHEFSIKKWGPTISYTTSKMLVNIKDFRYHNPIILAEGVADAEAISQIYPWVMGMLGNHTKLLVSKLLPLVTRKVYLMTDNDKGGYDGREKTIRALSKQVEIGIIEYPKEYKDPADYYLADPEKMKQQIKALGL